MATIPGALSDQALGASTQQLISEFVFVGGEVTENPVSGGVVVSGQGGNQNGTDVLENITLFINQATDAPVSFAVNDGVLEVVVTLPPGVDIGVSGPSEAVNASQMKAYVGDLINKALGGAAESDPFIANYKASLEKAISALQMQLDGQNVVVRVVSFGDGSGSASSALTTGAASTGNNIVFDAGQSAGNEVLALRLDQVNEGTTVTLKNVDNAMLIGSGSVVIDGNAGARVVGDLFDQMIVGGSGNDTLVGGGGNDTLVGGAGDDVYGFNAVGHYTIEGFGNGNNMLAFDFDGLTNVSQLTALVTGVTETNGNVTYEFNNGDASITLIGVSADEISASMLQFSL